jgi:hypothetical protein
MNNSDDSDDLIANSDETIYKVLYDRYLIEWQRTSNIEHKATCIIGFIGALLVFSVTLGLNNFSKILLSGWMLLFYLSCIGFLIFTFYNTMQALFFGNKDMNVLNTKNMMDDYVFLNKPILPDTIQVINKHIHENSEINISKNLLFRRAIILFFISCILLLIFTAWYTYSQHDDEVTNVIVKITNQSNNSSKITLPQNQNIISSIAKNDSIKNGSPTYDLIYGRYSRSLIFQSDSY